MSGSQESGVRSQEAGGRRQEGRKWGVGSRGVNFSKLSIFSRN
ncbi:hypothetical protein V0288_05970 [Pannus brasiliensis CCIBt3594]|uniref:Uncharacterized protein n=1 Tax=Pannus brasiliensis CCIBt3594 TaxID=1427578 RepID=A0AAW9QPL5_9CHRO